MIQMMLIPAIVAGVGLLLNVILLWNQVSREAGIAIIEIYFFLAWLTIVFLSSSRVARYDSYRIFRTNERRWVTLAVLTAVFLVWCSITGWGQPMLQGIEEGLVERFNQAEPSSAVAKGKEISTAAGKKLWNYFKLERLEKNLGIELAASKSATQVGSQARPFYGLASWSHWFVFVFLYLPTLVLYGIAARREEVSAWVERRRQARAERDRPRAGHAASEPGTAAGDIPHRPSWWLAMEGIIDAVAEVVGNLISARWFRV
ncbi:hypothetical protein A3I27_04350 [Candidatus Giovannonibacteria bacterium RIFCSPLOWO2_02_FULL_43_11b]|uniref:Uncharacterized protein n=1 Tax=Candidatus Giovannonibacteria bacterium RIFCSPHIGHO2_12_FULL_43_15 TaxID=1798341 RepID=A0A1F5WPC6_9BACT|nr:MAG: hypothetical protein A2739_00710 [Candidatus Giovannonibacteria bacterium RIFCSPHIGHO2_01_FULL_43_100]OGF66719.1 MAG: hypothetical protein A3B97_02290 [Candidatus Giovannonibacteria bacterium RIFCSPHIGHO2_02_FULL_43_32]OGF77495.1 MAG: hypothetical protein A3F23_00785 [Candidatus Giovannonibacteria bacterium RIFCSPHIGHO2_12_FULL_43_15]OGF78866.1 MAG: hypothetical protein A3A15_00185 [Candidatus Giovannonibacteria bacterium RIFCSPLOWO2_01_FULL_43_60]OGF89939.1 MAG: hypothetical protein A3